MDVVRPWGTQLSSIFFTAQRRHIGMGMDYTKMGFPLRMDTPQNRLCVSTVSMLEINQFMLGTVTSFA